MCRLSCPGESLSPVPCLQRFWEGGAPAKYLSWWRYIRQPMRLHTYNARARRLAFTSRRSARELATGTRRLTLGPRHPTHDDASLRRARGDAVRLLQHRIGIDPSSSGDLRPISKIGRVRLCPAPFCRPLRGLCKNSDPGGPPGTAQIQTRGPLRGLQQIRPGGGPPGDFAKL